MGSLLIDSNKLSDFRLFLCPPLVPKKNPQFYRIYLAFIGLGRVQSIVNTLNLLSITEMVVMCWMRYEITQPNPNRTLKIDCVHWPSPRLHVQFCVPCLPSICMSCIFHSYQGWNCICILNGFIGERLWARKGDFGPGKEREGMGIVRLSRAQTNPSGDSNHLQWNTDVRLKTPSDVPRRSKPASTMRWASSQRTVMSAGWNGPTSITIYNRSQMVGAIFTHNQVGLGKSPSRWVNISLATLNSTPK